MKIAIPLLGTRVSPGLWSARELAVVEVENGHVTGRHRVYIGTLRRIADFVDWLDEHHIDLILCDRVQGEICRTLNEHGVAVVAGVHSDLEPAIRRFASHLERWVRAGRVPEFRPQSPHGWQFAPGQTPRRESEARITGELQVPVDEPPSWHQRLVTRWRDRRPGHKPGRPGKVRGHDHDHASIVSH